MIPAFAAASKPNTDLLSMTSGLHHHTNRHGVWHMQPKNGLLRSTHADGDGDGARYEMHSPRRPDCAARCNIVVLWSRNGYRHQGGRLPDVQMWSAYEGMLARRERVPVQSRNYHAPDERLHRNVDGRPHLHRLQDLHFPTRQSDHHPEPAHPTRGTHPSQHL